jgi:3-hydroxyisobutyrate dehydrogenase-like beta-hydroxyacid dehydrogenase
VAIREVGFIGLGTMGNPMARNILKGGFPLAVCDIDPDAMAKLVEAGAKACGSPAEVAAQSDAVCSIVPDSPEVRQVILGDDGVAKGARPGTLIIEMSTIDPGTSRSIGQQVSALGLRMIDAPVCRSSEHAKRGELMFLVGGAKGDYEEALPLLRCMGDTFHHCGDNGAGVTMKLVNNVMGQGIALAVCESLALGVKAGLDLNQVIEILSGTAVSNKFMENVYRERGLNGDFSLGYALDWAHKDVGHALGLAAEVGVPMPAAGMVHALQNVARNQGKGRWDHTALITVFEQLGDVRLCKSTE